MSTGPDIARRRTGAVITAVAVASALLVLLAVGLGLAALYYWTQYVPPRPPRTWTELVMVSYSDGTVTYSVNGRDVTTEAELTEALRKARAGWPLSPGDTVVAEFMIFPYIVRSGEEGITREDFEMARAACRAAGVRSKGLEKPPPTWVDLSVSLDKTGMAHYESGKRIDAVGERELGRQVAKVVKDRGAVTVSLDPFITPFSGITQKHVDSAKAACEAAGAVVDRMPEHPLHPDKWEPVIGFSGGRKLEVRAVGVCNGELQFRLGKDVPPADGYAGLTEGLRKLITEEETKAGGVMLFAMKYGAAPELAVSDEHDKAARAAVKAAGTEIYFPACGVFGYREGGGRKLVAIEIVGSNAAGNQYSVNGTRVGGDEELDAMLSQMAIDFYGRHGDSRRHQLDVRLKTGAESGKAPTEEQLARARKTIARAAAAPDKPVLVNITGPCPDGSRYLLDGQPVEGEAGLKAALAKALADHRAGRKKPELYTLDVTLKVEVKPGITATEEQIAQARETIKAAGVGRPEKAP